MGVASLVVPIASHLLVQHVVPGKGRYAKVLIGTAVGAAAVTTLADRVAGHEADEPEDPRDRVVDDPDIPHGRGRELGGWPGRPAGSPARSRSARGCWPRRRG